MKTKASRIELIQGSPEWLEFRRAHIGASDAPVIMGTSPFKNLHQLWLEKQGLWEPHINSAMRHGIENEETARCLVEKELGFSLQPSVFAGFPHSWMAASLDGWNEEEQAILEIKCPVSEKSYLALLEGEGVPDYYQPQLDHQMLVMGLQSAFFAIWWNGSVHIKKVSLSDRANELVQREADFWQRVLDLDEPEETVIEYEKSDDAEALALAAEFQLVKDSILRMQRRAEELKSALIKKASSSAMDFGGVKLRQCAMKGRVDYGAIPELQTVDLEKYRSKPVTYWKIST